MESKLRDIDAAARMSQHQLLAWPGGIRLRHGHRDDERAMTEQLKTTMKLQPARLDLTQAGLAERAGVARKSIIVPDRIDAGPALDCARWTDGGPAAHSCR